MHIVEKMASVLRAEPSKPDASFSWVPTAEKYITIFNDESIQSFSYDFMNEVCMELSKVLAPLGIEIYSLCGKTDKRLLWTKPVVDPTVHQINYLLRNSSLHICTDAYTNELCGIFDTPSINLVGNRFAKNFIPFWGNASKNVVLRAETKKPSFAPFEEKKSINKIMPEVVIDQAFTLLGLKNRANFETVFIGDKHTELSVDYVPRTPFIDNSLSKFPVTVRFDKLFNVEALVHSQIGRPVDIISSQPIPRNFINGSMAAIKSISYLVDSNISPSDVSFAIGQGIDCNVFCLNKEFLSQKRLQFIDFLVREWKENELPDEDFSGLLLKSSKIVLYNGEKYASYEHMNRGEVLSEENKAYKTKLFAETLPNMKLYRKKD